jgi:hypothetical protein
MISRGFPSSSYFRRAANNIDLGDFVFECIAVTPEQAEEWKLPTRPTKTEAEGNRHAKRFKGETVELDAIPIDRLHRLILDVIFRHIDLRQLQILREAEKSERELLNALREAAP